MYRLVISSKDNVKYGVKIGLTPVEFFLASAEDVCAVISSLSSCKFVYSLAECSVSSVGDVLSYFESKDVKDVD